MFQHMRRLSAGALICSLLVIVCLLQACSRTKTYGHITIATNDIVDDGMLAARVSSALTAAGYPVDEQHPYTTQAWYNNNGDHSGYPQFTVCVMNGTGTAGLYQVANSCGIGHLTETDPKSYNDAERAELLLNRALDALVEDLKAKSKPIVRKDI